MSYLKSVLSTTTGSGAAAMLARLRIPEKEFEIEEGADESISFVRRGLKMGVFYIFDRSYLASKIVVRNPTLAESDQANAYQRSKSVVVEVYAGAMRGPQFEGDASGNLIVYDSTGKSYDAFERASFGAPADILLSAVVASAIEIFFAKRPPQTEPVPKRKIGVLGL